MDSVSNPETKMVRMNEGDRISNLSNDILGQILSHIPTKEAVATSVLSKRWENVWSNISTLDFNEFSINNRGGDYDSSHFKNFVDRVFRAFDATDMPSFTLYVNDISNFGYVCEWINNAVKYNVRSIDISIGVNDDFIHTLLKSSCTSELPENLFSCETLEFLELRWWNVMLKFPTSFDLPKLRSLHISMFNPCLEFTRQLFSSCPLLEELCVTIQSRYMNVEIEKYEHLKKRTLVVSSSSLKVLEVCWTLEVPEKVRHSLQFNHEMDIDAKNLKQLSVHDESIARYNGHHMFLLEEAKVDVGTGCICNYVPNERNEALFSRVLDVVENMGCVRTMYLSHTTIGALTVPNIDVIDIPFMYEVTQLELGYSSCVAAELLLLVLYHAQYVTSLVLSKVRGHKITARPFYLDVTYLDNHIVDCLRTLETIDFLGLDGTTNDLEMIRYFLVEAKILKSIKVSTLDSEELLKNMVCSGNYRKNQISLETARKFHDKVLKLPKASKDCKIVFDGLFL